MCGILGYSGKFSQEHLANGLNILSHRGPDGKGIYVNEHAGIGLAHTRLSILDLTKSGAQPMASLDGRIVIIFNGEIYNFKELRKTLESDGFRFRSRSDTEVLLNLYIKEKTDMLSKLNGIFAFAIWDEKNRHLFIARDNFGVKPLYYSATKRGVIFASEIKALLPFASQIGGFSDLDFQSLYRYLSFLWCPGEGTPLKAVRKLPPGTAMLVREGKIERRWTWYHLPPFHGVKKELSKRCAIEGTLAHLRRGVHRQMVADVPVGAFLSGGLDSSAVVAMAQEVNPNIACFTIKSEGPHEDGVTDDFPYAKKAAKHLGVNLHVVNISPERMARDIERMVFQLDEPLGDAAPLNVLYICKLAKEQGIKVLLSGTGGDDLFTGYRRHYAVALDRFWLRIPRGLRSIFKRMTNGLDKRKAWQRRIWKFFENANLDGDERLVNYFFWISEMESLSLFTDEIREEIKNVLAAAPFLEFLRPLPKSVSPLARMLTLEQRFFLADHNLLYTDKMSMATGVEVRVPFLDIELVEFAAHIPDNLKQHGSCGKWVLKKAMEAYLPHEVIYRPKTGFGAPLRRWMRHELHPLLNDVLSVESLKRRGLFDPLSVQKLIEANNSGALDVSHSLLSLLCIEIWCRKFVDSPIS